MKLLRGVQALKALEKGAAVTIGNFDGVHRGHQALLAQLSRQARHLGLPTLVVFFEPLPSEFFNGLFLTEKKSPGDAREAPARLMTRQEKLRYLAQLDVDYVYCLTFNEALSFMSPELFAEHFIFSLFRAKYILIGEDFRFGCGRLGSPQLLSHLCMPHQCIVDVYHDFLDHDVRVSSTQIRTALGAGNLRLVKQYLGRPYSLYGRVVRGEGLGRQWGVPTANVLMRERKLALSGVFLVHVQHHGHQMTWGVANLGRRPTLDGTKLVLEVHLFDFDGSLYDEHIEVFFIERLRMEKKFASIDALITQIHEDCRTAKAMIVDAVTHASELK